MPEAKPYKRYYTLCLDIEGKPCVVTGGGDVSRRKAAALSDAGAAVTVVAPEVDPVLDYMASQGEIQWKKKEFEPADLEGAYLAVAATNQRETNKRIGDLCRDKGILCNIVDEPDEGSYIVPTTIERGPLTIAIGTSGISPMLASSIRQELEMAYGDEFGDFLEMMAPLREAVLNEFPSQQKRAKIFEKMVSSRAVSMLRSGMAEQARKELEAIVEEARKEGPAGDSLPIIK